MFNLATILKMVLAGLLIYVLMGASLYLIQRRLLYLAGPAPSEELVQAAGLAFWPLSGAKHRGLVSSAPPDPPRGTVVVFHGNAGSAVDRSHYVHALVPLGYRVLLAEYPGYGGRSGRPSEAVIVADAKETVMRAYEEFGDPIILWGESLGSGVATAVAADTSVPIAGVVLVTPWDSLPSLVQSIYWFYPARWLVRDRYDNVAQLHAYAGPVAVLLAEQDEVVPTRHGMRLYTSIAGPKRLWVFEHAGHNSWPIAPDALWWGEVTQYISGFQATQEP